MNVFVSLAPQALTSLISFLPAAIICPDAIGMARILPVAILPTRRNDRDRVQHTCFRFFDFDDA